MGESFDRTFWVRFLELVDDELDEPRELEIVGGAAIALRYAPDHLTRDIDSANAGDAKLQAAIERAQKTIKESDGLRRAPPVGYTSLFDPPDDWESRRKRVLRHLKHLVVWIPERHDLAISKIARGTERDTVAISTMHAASPLNIDVLIERFNEAAVTHIGDPKTFRSSLLATVAGLFGDAEAARAAKKLKRPSWDLGSGETPNKRGRGRA